MAALGHWGGRLTPTADDVARQRPPRASGSVDPGATVTALQTRAGNRAVSRLLQAGGRSGTRALAVQRHSQASLERQLEMVEEQEEVGIQRRVGPVQRHSMPLPRNRRFANAQEATDVQMASTIHVIDAALPAILDRLRIRFPDRAAILTPSICSKLTDRGMGLESPAAADPSGTKFHLNVRSPFFYKEDGTPDEGFIRATVIHESMHCISHNHTGLQEADFISRPAKGAEPERRSTIGDATAPNDSLDEAMTERLSQQIFELLYPNEDYKTNYWQSLSDVGFHKTADGLKNLTNRPYKEKNWTADLAKLVEKEGVLTKEQLEAFYLKGEAGLRKLDASAPDRFKQRYAEVLKKWQAQKEGAWKRELPPGVLPASEWVDLLTSLLTKAANTWKYTEDQAVAYVTSATKGHELVTRSDPRSHIYKMAKQAYPDDIEILKTFYPNTRRDASGVKSLPASHMPRASTSWKGRNVSTTRGKHDPAKVAVEADAQSRKLGLNGDHPHILVPTRDTLGKTPFGSTDAKDAPYEAFVRGPNLPDVSSESMASVSGVNPDAKADLVISELGGGAYEMNKKVIFTKTAEPRTILHEIGHYKQDLAQINEATVNSKLLEYHNIVMSENPSSLGASTADSQIRLTYTKSPMVHLHKDWERILDDPPETSSDPSEYALVKKVVSGREQVALSEMEHHLRDARGPDGAVVYTPKMRWYLKRQLALEYFEKKYQKF